MTAAEPEISVVCPVFNEEEGVLEFYNRTTSALESISPSVRHQILFVNDGSADGTSSILHKLAI